MVDHGDETPKPSTPDIVVTEAEGSNDNEVTKSSAE
jgi:hypothetical protein